MGESTRIVVLGKTGTGKSSLANTIFGEAVFETCAGFNACTQKCQAVTKFVHGRSLLWIDTPGLFDTDKPEEEMKPEIVRCITECAPGPHVFLVVLKVATFTKQEHEVIDRLQQYFSEEAFKYAILVFTHGDQLDEGMQIEEFIEHSKELSNLVKKFGGRCHVIDNKRWKKNQQAEYRTNQFQVPELLKRIDELIEANQEGCYTNEMLQAVKSDIQQEEVNARQSSADMSPEEIAKKSKTNVFAKQMFKFAVVSTGALLGAFLGGAMKLRRQEGSTVALVAGVAIGTAAGIAAGVDATS